MDRKPPWRLDGPLPDLVAVTAGGLASLRWESTLESLVSGRRDALYGTFAGVHGTLLGFVLAALTIVLGYTQLERFDPVRSAGHFPALFGIYLSGVRTGALGLVVSTVALLADRQVSPHAWMTAIVLSVSLLSALRLARVLWVTYRVVDVVSRPNVRQPGQSE